MNCECSGVVKTFWEIWICSPKIRGTAQIIGGVRCLICKPRVTKLLYVFFCVTKEKIENIGKVNIMHARAHTFLFYIWCVHCFHYSVFSCTKLVWANPRLHAESFKPVLHVTTLSPRYCAIFTYYFNTNAYFSLSISILLLTSIFCWNNVLVNWKEIDVLSEQICFDALIFGHEYSFFTKIVSPGSFIFHSFNGKCIITNKMTEK